MGFLSDAFIATNAELGATKFDVVGGPIAFFPTLQGRNIGPVELLMLEFILQEPIRPNLDIFLDTLDQHIIRGDGSTDEWIYQLPDTMVVRLAKLTAAEISRYGTTWASIEEFLGPKEIAPIAAITDYLQELCQLAMCAQVEQKHMYMWISL